MSASELLGAPLEVSAGWLPHISICNIRTASSSMCRDLASCVESICRDLWESAVADDLVRRHYQELLGVSTPMELLCRRRWLNDVVNATQFSQWRTETAVARLMHGVHIDGRDLFAALRRAFLASQVPLLARADSVVNWMHVLGAVEEQDPMQRKVMAGEAWAAMSQVVTEETLIWPVQTAHFVDGGLKAWFEGSDLDLCELRSWLQGLQSRLEATPALGRYGPAGDSSQVRPRHLSRLIADLK